jgi:hypothetical protein
MKRQQDNIKDIPEKKSSWYLFLGTGFLVFIFLITYMYSPRPIIVPKVTQTQIRKTIAVGDLHGDLSNTIRTFRMAGLIDKNNDWAAGNSIFVQTVRSV